MKARILKICCLIFFLSAVALDQDVASFEKRVTVKKLANGLTVIVCERPEAPVFSFFTLVDAGSAQDPLLATGLAHMFEHMAFKGTDKIGTTNYPAEKVALEKVETAYAAYIAERDKSVGQDKAKLQQLEKTWKDATTEADKYVKANEFGKVIEQNGGEGMNASTSHDETEYHYSMPENRFELWAYLESERFLHAHRQQSLRTPARAVHRRGLRGAPVSPPWRWMDIGPQPLLRHRRAEILRHLLCSIEHGDRRCRRPEAGTGHADP
jgi:Insulinase (Peptidase family M16)